MNPHDTTNSAGALKQFCDAHTSETRAFFAWSALCWGGIILLAHLAFYSDLYVSFVTDNFDDFGSGVWIPLTAIIVGAACMITGGWKAERAHARKRAHMARLKYLVKTGSGRA